MSGEAHEVNGDRVEVLDYICGDCGEYVDGDGDGWWHRDPALNPQYDDNGNVIAAPAEAREEGPGG